MEKYIILTDVGFRKNHSTQMALSILVDKVYQLISCKKHIIGVYIDLIKAFDMINYDILLDKLYHYGIRGMTLNWISYYLQDRVCVCVCPANILVFYFSAIRRDIDLKCIQDTYSVVLNSLKNMDLHMLKVKVTVTAHCFLKVQSYHNN